MEQDEQLNLIIEFESGEISHENFLRLFSHLIEKGLCWKLQGFYGRTAQDLIDNKIISKEGEILK
jgi:hypothetical protein